MKKLTVAEYSHLFKIPESTVRYKIKKKKLAVTKELVDGKQTTMINVENYDDVAVKNTEVAASITTNENIGTNDVAATLQKPENKTIDNDQVNNSDQLINLLQQMYKDNKQLAAEAGQVKLLETSESNTKKLYFELQQQYNQLQQQLAESQSESKIKDVQIKELNNRFEEKEKIIKDLEEKIKDLEKSYEPEKESSIWFKKL